MAEICRIVSVEHDPDLELSGVLDNRKNKYIPLFSAHSCKLLPQKNKRPNNEKKGDSVNSLLRSEEVVAVAGLRVGDEVSIITAKDRPRGVITIKSKHVQYDPNSPLIIWTTDQPWA